MATDDLALVEQHVRQAKEIIARQKQRVLHLDSIGADTSALSRPWICSRPTCGFSGLTEITSSISAKGLK
jgi:hypothetical protein